MTKFLLPATFAKKIFTAFIVCFLLNTAQSFSQAGTLDSSFGVNGKVKTDFNQGRDEAKGVITQEDGKMIVVGSTTIGDHYDFAIARYKENGDLDSAFGKNGKVSTDFNGLDDGANCVALDLTGKILVAGSTIISSNSESDFAIARYKSNGKLDSTFGKNGTVITDFSGMFDTRQDVINSIVIQPDGKIICIGYSTGAFTGFALARYNSNGNLDSSFGTNGKALTDFLGNNGDAKAYSASLQKDGKIIVSGTVQSPTLSDDDFALARYNHNGTIDLTFGVKGKTKIDFRSLDDVGFAVGLQSDGKIITAGITSPNNNGLTGIAVARCDSSGILDPTFGDNGKVITALGLSSVGSAIIIQPDDKILVAGFSNSYNNSLEDFGLIRYKVGGSLDSTFGINGKMITDFGAHEEASAITLQPNGKIIAAGYFYLEGLGMDFAIGEYKGDSPMTASIQKNISKLEGNSGTTPATFKIILNAASTKTITVNFTTVDGTAKAGQDYVAASGKVTFKLGITSKNVTVNIIGDNIAEPNEKFSLQLSNPTNAILGTPATATCTIKNDDPSFASAASNENAGTRYIKLYPNPAKDVLRIEGLNESINTIISIIDMQGKVITKTTTSTSTCSLNVKQLPSGTYFVQLESEHNITTLKFVKE
jgi:uncharacterized delta-60 repeat protein